ncbi:MAG: hypothetical protein Q9227_002907 [Pyrenula ochraceoflavens]
MLNYQRRKARDEKPRKLDDNAGHVRIQSDEQIESLDDGNLQPEDDRKRHSDDDATRLSKSHIRTLSGNEANFDRGAGSTTPQSVLYDPARDTTTSRASPGRMLSAHAHSPQLGRGLYANTVRSSAQASVAARRAKFGSNLVYEPDKFHPPVGSQPYRAFSERNSGILLQPETRPITQDQLVNEVKGIYAGLVMVEKKLPDSLDHMLAFVYLSYSMMALLKESITSFEETWIECLGDLARYRMAIEEADLRDRETWSGVARMWYNKAADKSPNVGRIQHHLAVLARPNIVEQLFYYSKALVSLVPFHNARESVMLLFNPFLEGADTASQKYPVLEATFVKSNGLLFTRGLIRDYVSLSQQFLSILDNHIGRVASKWRVQGPEIASTLCAALQDFGDPEAFITKTLRENEEKLKLRVAQEGIQSGESNEDQSQAPTTPEQIISEYRTPTELWDHIHEQDFNIERLSPRSSQDNFPLEAKFHGSTEVVSYAYFVTMRTFSINLQRIGDKNVLPFVHVMLAFIWSLAYVPSLLIYVENYIPWEKIAGFLNTIGRSGVVDVHVEQDTFPHSLSGTGRQLPEDFVMRGLLWSKSYFPSRFFTDNIIDEDERSLELPSHNITRAERCLWLGRQLSQASKAMKQILTL